MKRLCIAFVMVWILAGGVLAGEAEKTGDASGKKAPAADRSKDPAVNDWYDKLLVAYMKADWPEVKDLFKSWQKMRLKLSTPQRKDVIYMRKSAKQFRPRWWNFTRSSKNLSFKARIWGRRFTANYVPSETLGMQAAVGVRRGKLQVIVSWRPSYIDSPKSFSNDNSFGVYVPNAKKYGFTMGHMGEVIVWHELGHNYISLNLPAKHVIKLYQEYGMLYRHMQEFYADMTAMYHASPPGRLFTMKFRMMSLVDNDENNAHTRGCGHAIGALLLSKILEEPKKWPSFHFPGKVPEEEIERYAIIYLYRHVEPTWTLAEDRQLREFINKWIRSKGEAVLRRKGRVSLPNRQTMMIMAGEDREFQRKRDKWVKRKLEAIIASGRADKPEIFEKDMKDIENRTRWIRVRKMGDDDDEDDDDKKRKSSRRRSKKKKSKDRKEKKKDKDDDLDDVLGDEEDEEKEE